MKNNLILIALTVFLAATSFFWIQVLRIRDLPTPQPENKSIISGAEAQAFVEVAQSLLIDYKSPMPEAYKREPFYKDYLVQIPEEKPKTKPPSEVFIVSSVIYNKSRPFAVINGKILAEGDSISNAEFDYDFTIENIAFNEVKINDGQKKYVLRTMEK